MAFQEELKQRIEEQSLSIGDAKMSENKLDCAVRPIKRRMPHAGFRLVEGELLARRHHEQWHRVQATMHRVDGAGILTVIQPEFVPVPLYLVQIDTNHKLIR